MNNRLTFANLFNAYPLYNYMVNDAVKVFIFSFDGDYQDYLSCVLETAQLVDKKLEVIIFTNKKDEDKTKYLAEWPELCNFFEIDNKPLSGNVDSYGKINFIDFNNVNDTTKFLSIYNFAIRYAFISCGNQSERVGQLIKARNALYKQSFILFYLGNNGVVNFINEGGFKRSDFNAADKNLDRYAFNAHLLWYGKVKGKNLEDVYNEFVTSDDYVSSYFLALSFKYKLKAFGLDINNIESNIAQLDKKIKENEKFTAKLAYFEHKRWNVNKIINGWSAPKEGGQNKYLYALDKIHLKENKFRGHIDYSKKIHGCIVHSTPAIGITDNFDWENGPINNLDGLDRMSIELHRVYAKNSQNYWEEHSIESDESLSAIASLLRKDRDSQYELEKFYIAIYGVLNHDSSQCKSFSGIQNKLLAYAKKKLSPDNYKKLAKAVNDLYVKLFTTIKAYSYEDFKKKDFDIIYSLPFILTYNFRNNIGLPLLVPAKKENVKQCIIDNIASVICIKPLCVTYIARINENQVDNAETVVKPTCTYLKTNLNTKISLLVSLNKNSGEISELLKNLKDKRIIDDYKILVGVEELQIDDASINYLRSKQINFFNVTKHTFEDEELNYEFVSTLYKTFNTFSFDYSKQRFTKFKFVKNDKRLNYLSSIPTFSNEFVEFGELLNLTYGEASLKGSYFVDKKTTYILWNSFIKNKSESEVKRYNNFCHDFGVIYAKYHKSNKGNETLIPYEQILKNKYSDYLQILFDNKLAIIEIKNDESLIRFQNIDLIDLFQKSGNLFERYCYYQCVESGYFDEVISGMYFDYNGNAISNEMDLILVKGFNLVLAECKAVESVDEHMIKKLYYVGQLFGTNTQLVFATTDSSDDRKRLLLLAKQLGVKIIDSCYKNMSFADEIINFIENK